jgi:hypothetical protein
LYLITSLSVVYKENDLDRTRPRPPKPRKSREPGIFLAKKGSHVILATGAEIERLFRDKGFSVSSEALDLKIAKLSREGKHG